MKKLEKVRNRVLALSMLIFVTTVSFGQFGVKNYGTQGVNCDSSLYYNGVFHNTSSSEYYYSGKIHFLGDFLNNGMFSYKSDAGCNDQVIMIGLSRQTVSGSGDFVLGNVQFYNLEGITVKSNLNIEKDVTFVKGIVDLYGDTSINLGLNSMALDASDYSHIVGRVSKKGNGVFEFPIGNGKFYRPITIDNTSGSVQDVIEVVYNENYDGPLDRQGHIESVQTSENWNVKLSGVSTDRKITLGWDIDKGSDPSITSELDKMTVVYWNDILGQWVDLGFESITGNKERGQITATASKEGLYSIAKVNYYAVLETVSNGREITAGKGLEEITFRLTLYDKEGNTILNKSGNDMPFTISDNTFNCDDCAASYSDYKFPEELSSLGFAKGVIKPLESSADVEVSVINDNRLEDDMEVMQVTVSEINDKIAPLREGAFEASATIEDDDVATVSMETWKIESFEGNYASVKLLLDTANETSEDILVYLNYNLAIDLKPYLKSIDHVIMRPELEKDFKFKNTPVVFRPGSKEAIFQLELLSDNLLEEEENLELFITKPNTPRVVIDEENNTTGIVIGDRTYAGVDYTFVGGDEDQGEGMLDISVNLIGKDGRPVTNVLDQPMLIEFDFEDITTDEDIDMDRTDSFAIIGSGESKTMFRMGMMDDDLIEGAESFMLMYKSASITNSRIKAIKDYMIIDIPMSDINLDEDSDGDGISNEAEDSNGDGNPFNDDCDNDGEPNFLDADDCFIVKTSGFSPNGDGINDKFVIYSNLNNEYTKNEVIIYDRNGAEVYKAENYKNDWTGVNKYGILLPAGSYYVSLTGYKTGSDKLMVIHEGWVSMLY